ncbi:hypothetical protein OS493_029338 [Desmophyllum pertusum]|uniref:Uncharacterized protein n=1 Tax=Desmophyllum pertusum TaxID=174260 RepID=A0A9W9Z9I0_9CNID|nr:hypothetical protein OS493_029338 [Desmophyllum pertusum]
MHENTRPSFQMKLLAKDGNATQFASYGLSTVGDQMRLKEIASEIPLVIRRHRKKHTALAEIMLYDLIFQEDICNLLHLLDLELLVKFASSHFYNAATLQFAETDFCDSHYY